MGQGFWGGFPPAALAIPAAVENSMGAFPRRHWLSLPLWCPRGACFFGRLSPLPLAYLSAPYPPDPLPRRGRGRPKLFHARGFAPCIPSIRPPAALVRPAVSAPSGAGCCILPRLLCLPYQCFPAPYPPSPRSQSALPRRGRGRPKLFHARGFAPCIPSIRPPAALVRPAVSAPSGAGCCILPRLLCLPYQCFPAPYPPSPRSQSALPRRGRGRPKLFFARGFAPCIPGLEPGRHLQNQPSGCPEWGFAPCETGVAFRYPAGAWQLRRGTGKQCRQPRRGGTGGDGTIRR